MRNKKGQFGLSLLVSAIIGIAIFGLVGSIVVGLLGDFREDQRACPSGDWVLNTTAENCYETGNTSNTTAMALSVEYNATVDSQGGITNLTSRAPIIGSVIFLIIIVGMFTLLQKQRGA